MRFAPAWLLVLLAAVLAAQPAASPEDLYQRVRQRVLADINRLPNFTCVQTITRRVYGAASPNRRPPQCDEILRDQRAEKPTMPLLLSDRLRVDVAIADKHEVYAWVGAARFEEGDLQQLVGGGQTMMGDFGSLLLAIFSQHPAMRFIGERKIGARRLLEYSYQTPVNSSKYYVRVGQEQVTTAYEGSVFLDSVTADVVRVTTRSAVLPQETGYCQVAGKLDYARLRIDTSDVLIPHEASSWALDRDGGDMVSVSSYSGCREYVGESVLRFDDPESSQPPAASGATAPASSLTPVSPPPAIPPGLPLACTIVTPIDSNTAATGDPFEAVLRSPIMDASGKVLAPVGARIHGRLMAFIEHPASRTRKEFYEIGVQLRSVELGGKRVPLAATLVKETQHRGAWLRLNLHPSFGTFVFYEKKVHLINLDSKWVTATPVAAATTPR